jgi:flavin-dependent dehydrogenase
MRALIIGGGIAGLCSSLELQKHGIHCTLIDRGKNESSAIAAGMINPIVFRRTTKSWRADDFFPYLKRYYQTLEVDTKSSFFHPLTVRRIFSSEQERNEWLKKEVKPEYTNYLEVIDSNDDEYNLVQIFSQKTPIFHNLQEFHSFLKIFRLDQ